MTNNLPRGPVGILGDDPDRLKVRATLLCRDSGV